MRLIQIFLYKLWKERRRRNAALQLRNYAILSASQQLCCLNEILNRDLWGTDLELVHKKLDQLHRDLTDKKYIL